MKKRLLIIILALITVLLFSACDDGSDISSDTSGTAPQTTDTEIDTITTEPTPDTEPADTEPDTEELPTGTDTAPETEIIDDPEPVFCNPLTGLESDVDLSVKRPVGIMINNIKKATPQHGICDADIIYECLAEGGITRLLMFKTEYEKLGVVGSIRSSRDYYLDFVRDFDALYVHAGGSPEAYAQIDSRKIENLDGVNMHLPDTFYRDEWRKKNMAYEHSLMATGEGIAKGIKSKKYRTTLKDGFENPLHFVTYGTRAELDGDSATHIMLKYHKNQVVDLIYNAETDKYERYQFGGIPHIDNNTGDILSFDNVIVLLTDLWVIDGDDKGRLNVVTTGEGNGYYAAGGKYVPIKWKKADRDGVLELYNTDGSQLLINRGTTFVSVFDKDYKHTLDDSPFTPKK